MPALSLPCSRCGRQAVRLTLPRIPDELRGFVGGILGIANGKLSRLGFRLTVPPSGEIADAIPAEQLPAISRALEVECTRCVARYDTYRPHTAAEAAR